MGRRAEGWKLKPVRGILYVRFTHRKKRHEISTGERDIGRASEIAARIYADTISGKWRPVGTGRPGAYQPLDELFAEWLASIESDHDEETVETYKWMVRRKFLPYFRSMETVTSSAALADYARARLKKVEIGTVRKELAPLMVFLRWCKEQGVIVDVPPRPQLPERATGVHAGRQRRQPVDISPAMADAILAALPEMSAKPSRLDGEHFAVRARFIFMRETGLRPGTIDKLSVPEHFRPGSSELRITRDIDKARFARHIELTPRAQAAIESVITGPGIVFGKHHYWPYLKAAALAVGMDPELAKDFAPYDFRHSRATEFLEVSGNMPGTAYQLGHKLLTTTNKYVRANRRAGDLVVRAMQFRGNSGDHMQDEADETREKTPLLPSKQWNMVSNPHEAKQANNRVEVAQEGPAKGGLLGDSGIRSQLPRRPRKRPRGRAVTRRVKGAS